MKRSTIEQPTLFDSHSGGHDYGDAANDGQDFGHEFPFVRAGAPAETALPDVGVSVSLASRKLALEAVAKMYGRYNQGKGMQKAVAVPQLRREIEPRYFDVDYVAERAEINGHYTPAIERATLQPILKEQELIKAGFSEADVDLVALSIIKQARDHFGISVRAKERAANLNKVNKKHQR